VKILVCISNVPDTTSKINFIDGDTKFDTNGVSFVINPNDEFGLTRAMWFKEKQGASVDIINVGGAETEPTMRKCLAIGADNAIRVNAEPIDSFAVAQEIATVAKDGAYDLIIAGRESIDYNGGVVPGMVAAILDANFVSLVEESDLRIPNMRGIMMARKKPLTVVEPKNAASLTEASGFSKPAPKGSVTLVDANNLDQLIDLLHKEAKVI